MGMVCGVTLSGCQVRVDQNLRVLDEEELIARPPSGRFGRLALAVDAQPHIFPVNYLYEDRSVVVRTTHGHARRVSGRAFGSALQGS